MQQIDYRDLTGLRQKVARKTTQMYTQKEFDIILTGRGRGEGSFLAGGAIPSPLRGAERNMGTSPAHKRALEWGGVQAP
ncbi:MAG TPA: hypothetical protein V6D25_30570, partial [Leptolyngbyaceae cyanobacterium]